MPSGEGFLAFLGVEILLLLKSLYIITAPSTTEDAISSLLLKKFDINISY